MFTPRHIPLMACLLLGCTSEQAASPVAPPAPSAPASLAPVTEGPSVWLERAQGDSGATVEVRFKRRPGREGPRTVELWLAHDAGLALESATPGGAATTAQKQVVAKTAEPGQVRLVLFGTGSLDRIGDGALAVVRFREVTGGTHTVELLDRRPAFAPADTDLGVVIGPALTLTSDGGTP